MRLSYLFSVLVFASSLSVGGHVTKIVKVFWIPPDVETYIPVTPENIEEMAFKIVEIKDDKQASDVMALIQKTNQVVESKRIRVKISSHDKFYNFDSNGIGVSSAGEAVKIDLKRLKQVLCE